MNFKRFLLERPDEVILNGKKHTDADDDAAILGIKGNDYCYIDTPSRETKSIKINEKEYSIETAINLANEFNEALIDLDLLEYYGELVFIKRKTHHNASVLHFLLKHSKDGHVSKELLNKKIVSDAVNDIVTLGCYFEVSCRYWPSGKLMSFWQVPDKDQIVKICQILKAVPKDLTIEIPTGPATFTLKKFSDITGEEEKIEMPKFNHLLSPIAKEELRKQQKIDKNRVAKGLGSRKMLPNQTKDKTTAQARAQLSTSEETER